MRQDQMTDPGICRAFNSSIPAPNELEIFPQL